MTDSIQVFPIGFRVTDSSGDPVSDAKIKFYDAGTSTAKEVFSDQDLSVSLGTVVRTRSDGLPVSGGSTTVLIYVGVEDFKYEITDEDDVPIAPVQDDVRGAISTTVSSFAIPVTEVTSKTANYTVLSSDFGSWLTCNPTGGTFTITFPTAIGASGKGFGIKHVGTANVVRWATVSAQTADGATTGKVKLQYDSIWVVSDGANWIISQEKKDFTPVGAFVDYTGTTKTGYVRANGLTIGELGSGATTADDNTEDLYEHLWDNYADSICAVSTGRGASAAADFAAGKTLAVLDRRGRTFAGVDDMGTSTASRLTSTTMSPDGITKGATGGTQTHTLTTAESAAHTHTGTTSSDGAHQHTYSGPQNEAGGDGGNSVVDSSTNTSTSSDGAHTHTFTSASTGGGGAHLNMQPTMLGTVLLKL
jgi:microcystin-dependent protein